ncbi:uncharacterized protein G2W53_024909 [Senna tora]|uniref:DUF7950 domain-containing protein n=1 Tax=Senna tora TaxID=362788 RepID=A0A834WJS9_9FABA|nr:uncharacterized protein G2W53_024909 [Senna tora]
MDVGEGWRRSGIRCTGGAQDKTIMNRLMLRFRPIAPKPAAGGPLHGGSPAAVKEKVMVASRRTKRKYVRVGRNNSSKGCNNEVKEKKKNDQELKNRSAFTLQLLPEKNLSSNGGSWRVTDNKQDHENYLMMSDESGIISSNNNNNNNNDNPNGALDERAAGAVETWVTVDYVGERCMKEDARGGLGRTDTEKLRNLEGDTCPGFVSDGLNRVVWVNGAFREMVRVNEEGMVMEVRLLTKEKEKERSLMSYRELTCQAKVQYTWRKEKWSQMVVPCDAWRLDGGGFAWRLDVKAALSLDHRNGDLLALGYRNGMHSCPDGHAYKNINDALFFNLQGFNDLYYINDEAITFRFS